MPIKIDGVEYETRIGAYRRREIQHPGTKAWHVLKVCAITRDQDDDVFVMPIKSFVGAYGNQSFLGGLPALVGGNVDEGKTLRSTLVDEIKQETHGQYEPGTERTFVDIVFVPGGACYVFYSCDVRKTEKTLFVTKAMKEMTGQHLRFSAKDLMDEINRVRLTAHPTVTDVKQAILRIYDSTDLPDLVRKAALASNVSENTYDLQITNNRIDFLNNSHALDAMAEYLRGRIDAAMSMHAKEKLQTRLLILLLIVVLLGAVLGFFAL
ncbi:hypothetical protein [Sorangium sp. So ce861]|uniref:hypothetical protein n=1 Tax=Sorangium sp. So ce861 TaxID=3133323 RepID=UPI003F5D928E